MKIGAMVWGVCLLFVASSLGCGGGSNRTPVATVASPFTEAHARVFEDGIDFVADPEVLEGTWGDDWASELERRVSDADLIARVVVDTMRIDTDLDRNTSFRLEATIQETLLGEAPESEVTLAVHQGDPGYSSVEGNEQRILHQPLVVYIKWYEVAEDDVRPHWHLSPASEGVLTRTRDLVARRIEGPSDEPQRVIISQD